ncbi:MAG: MazG family protein [Caldilineaceae bacterium]|nr:MazG family protein [Caldilineaceae bacterium]
MSIEFDGVDLPRADLILVGMGPGAWRDVSLGAWQALTGAPAVILRTAQHPVAAQLAALRADVRTCDDLYDAHAAFADVYAAIVARVLDAAVTTPGLVYAVPGHPLVGEITTRRLLDEARARGMSTAVVGSASFVEPAFAAVGVDPMDGGQVVDAMLLAHMHHPKVEVGLPLLAAQVYARQVASDLKLTLMNAYPDEHPVTVIRGAGTDDQRLHTTPLHALDQADDFDHMTSVYVPPLDDARSFTDLQEIVAHLRAPEGCPWDQEQTLASLRQDLLGEAVEVLEAIDVEETGEDNSLHIAEELGDLLLLATMLIQIATEEGRFKMADVAQHIVHKLIRRHPHVFGDAEVESLDDIFTNWDAIKAEEKAAKGQPTDDPLAGVPPHLPALEKARKLQSKAQKAGLLDRAALAAQSPTLAALFEDVSDADALGRLLWQLVALAHERDLNAEDALRAYAVGFRERVADGA